jgi:hypothetical protein
MLIVIWNYRRFLPCDQEIICAGYSLPTGFKESVWKIEMTQTLTPSIFVLGLEDQWSTDFSENETIYGT